jgi:flagellin
MAAVLSTNMASLYAQKNLSTAQTSLAQSVQRLSSGTRINSAKDDAAGYGMAQSISSTKNIVDQNIRNAKDGISWAQTAEGALDVVGKILQRALTLTTQKLDTTLNQDQIDSINGELASLAKEITNIQQRTKFQGGTGSTSVFTTPIDVSTGATDLTRLTATMITVTDLYNENTSAISNAFTADAGAPYANGEFAPGSDYADGNYTNVALASQTGTGSGATIDFTVTAGAVSAVTVNNAGSGYAAGNILVLADEASRDGSGFSMKVSTVTAAGAGRYASVTAVQDLIAENATNRGALGAKINSLEYAVDNMQTLSTNLADGISRIVDTDYASETSNLTRSQILQQAATSMLAQANQMPNVILTLLK